MIHMNSNNNGWCYPHEATDDILREDQTCLYLLLGKCRIVWGVNMLYDTYLYQKIHYSTHFHSKKDSKTCHTLCLKFISSWLTRQYIGTLYIEKQVVIQWINSKYSVVGAVLNEYLIVISCSSSIKTIFIYHMIYLGEIHRWTKNSAQVLRVLNQIDVGVWFKLSQVYIGPSVIHQTNHFVHMCHTSTLCTFL